MHEFRVLLTRWMWCLLILLAPAARAETPPHSTVLPGVGAHDPRVGVDMRTPPWTALVRVQIPGVSRCTGVLVSPRQVLTAAHCIWGRRVGHFLQAGSIHVLAGYAAGAMRGHAVAASVRIAEGYDPLRPYESQGADAALLTLADPLADQSHVLELTPSDWPPNGPVMIGGYNQDRNEVIEVDPACHLAGVAHDAGGRELLTHDCTATRGVSGAPVLARATDGNWMVAGLAVGAFEGRAGGVAVPATKLRELLRQ